MLKDENLQEIVDSDSISEINRNTFVQLISDRSDLSKKDMQRIASKLESVWQKTTNERSGRIFKHYCPRKFNFVDSDRRYFGVLFDALNS